MFWLLYRLFNFAKCKKGLRPLNRVYIVLKFESKMMYTVGVVFINCCIIDVTSVFDLVDTHATVFIKPHLPKLPHLS